MYIQFIQKNIIFQKKWFLSNNLNDVAKPIKLIRNVLINWVMKFWIFFIFSTIILSQNDFSLEDLNPTSDHYGDNIGTSFFEGKVTLNYFGYFT